MPFPILSKSPKSLSLLGNIIFPIKPLKFSLLILIEDINSITLSRGKTQLLPDNRSNPFSCYSPIILIGEFFSENLGDF